MYEVELKVRADHEAVRDRLAERSVERVGAVRQVDTYYGAPHRDFGETDEALRVRRETQEGGDPRHELTYKGPKVDADSKTRQEHETGVDDPDAVDAALQALGFDPVATVEKDRERYRIGEYAVALDAVDGLGTFVEVERAAAENEIEAVREGAADLLADLGLDPGAGIRTSYLGLLLADPE
ncbi:MAG: class IV adenylate cyclase [Halobacteriales archaeon]